VAISVVEKIIAIASGNLSAVSSTGLASGVHNNNNTTTSSTNSSSSLSRTDPSIKIGGPVIDQSVEQQRLQSHIGGSSNHIEVPAKASLSADDLIPLIAFAFAMYFQSLKITAVNPSTSTRTHGFRGTDRELVSVNFILYLFIFLSSIFIVLMCEYHSCCYYLF